MTANKIKAKEIDIHLLSLILCKLSADSSTVSLILQDFFSTVLIGCPLLDQTACIKYVCNCAKTRHGVQKQDSELYFSSRVFIDCIFQNADFPE